jgi:hypothetical protein
VVPDGLVGDAQAAGDLAVSRSPGEEFQDVAFTAGEFGEGAWRERLAAAGEEVDDALRDAGTVHSFAPGGRLDGPVTSVLSAPLSR